MPESLDHLELLIGDRLDGEAATVEERHVGELGRVPQEGEGHHFGEALDELDVPRELARGGRLRGVVGIDGAALWRCLVAWRIFRP